MATGGNFTLGQANDAGAVTSLKLTPGASWGDGTTLLDVDGRGDPATGVGVVDSAIVGRGKTGVAGLGTYPGAGGRGVFGSGHEYGVVGENIGGFAGVRGIGHGAYGVEGISTNGFGGRFSSVNSTGLRADSDKERAAQFDIYKATNASPTFVAATRGVGEAGQFQILNPSNPSAALEAITNGSGPALRVRGRASFRTVGGGTIPSGRRTLTVNNSAATPRSHISVTLVGDPGKAVLVWVGHGEGSFTLHLSAPVGADTRFTYFIVEP